MALTVIRQKEMPRRKELNGVAAGLASSFSSRNNDADGYWALGVLYKLVNEAEANKITIDLMSSKSCPNFKHIKEIASPYYNYLIDQLMKKKFKTQQITSALIEIQFNVAPSAQQIMFKSTWGEPYICRVILTDDLNKQHIKESRGWCGQHDPKKEHRSIRRYAL